MFRNPESRVAFVIGNGAYEGHAVLPNPRNDAKAVGTAMENLGFRVFPGMDLDHDAMVEKFEQFESHLEELQAVDVALIYYSGHGLQDNNTNYLVPVGAETSSEDKVGKLINLQELIDRITPHSKRRLVILDACRNNPAAPKLTKDIQKTRGILVGGEVVTTDGLAEVEAATNTFLAFAAAPGKVAYDGVGEFSPFSGALIRHIEAIDVPLTNLMVRVRNDVLAVTSDKQQTWDNTSLTGSFFFNPSSLLLLIGNMIGLAALVSSLIPYSFLLSDGAGAGWIAIGAVIVVSVLTLFLSGLHSAYARLRGENDNGGPENGGGNQRIWQNVKRGLTGGVFGGMIAAFLIAVPYRIFWLWSLPYGCPITPEMAKIWNDYCPPPLGEIITEITLASVFVAATLGAFSLVAADWPSVVQNKFLLFWNRLTSKQKIVVGAVLGGIAAGIVTAPLVTLYFGRLERPFLTPFLMAPGAILGTAVISFTIVNYSLEKFSLKRLANSAVSAIKATIASSAVAAVFLGFLYAIGFVDFIFGNVFDIYNVLRESAPNYARLSLLFGGLIYGLVIGPILGLLIGLTLIWTTENRDSKYQ